MRFAGRCRQRCLPEQAPELLGHPLRPANDLLIGEAPHAPAHGEQGRVAEGIALHRPTRPVRGSAIRLHDQPLLAEYEVALEALDLDVYVRPVNAVVVTQRQEHLLEL